MKHLKKIQAASGATFALFLLLHLSTTISALGGGGTYDTVLLTLRSIYRPHIIVELLLIGIPLTVHVVCAVLSILQRRREGPRTKPSPAVRAHRWTGYFLLLVIAGHIFATRIMTSGTADFSYLAYSVLNWAPAIVPYYFILGIAGAVHVVLGLGFAARILIGKRTPPTKVWAVAAIAIALLVAAGVASIALDSKQADRSRFPEFEELYERYLPFMKPTFSEED